MLLLTYSGTTSFTLLSYVSQRDRATLDNCRRAACTCAGERVEVVKGDYDESESSDDVSVETAID